MVSMADTGDLTEFGLAPPRLSLTIELDEGAPIELEVGNTALAALDR